MELAAPASQTGGRVFCVRSNSNDRDTSASSAVPRPFVARASLSLADVANRARQNRRGFADPNSTARPFSAFDLLRAYSGPPFRLRFVPLNLFFLAIGFHSLRLGAGAVTSPLPFRLKCTPTRRFSASVPTPACLQGWHSDRPLGFLLNSYGALRLTTPSLILPYDRCCYSVSNLSKLICASSSLTSRTTGVNMRKHYLPISSFRSSKRCFIGSSQRKMATLQTSCTAACFCAGTRTSISARSLAASAKRGKMLHSTCSTGPYPSSALDPPLTFFEQSAQPPD